MYIAFVKSPCKSGNIVVTIDVTYYPVRKLKATNYSVNSFVHLFLAYNSKFELSIKVLLHLTTVFLLTLLLELVFKNIQHQLSQHKFKKLLCCLEGYSIQRLCSLYVIFRIDQYSQSPDALMRREE